MSDFDLDALLAGAVDDYQRNTLPQIKPAGTAQARATATHRKRVHAVAMSAVAALVVAVPIAAYAATEHNHNGPPPVGSSQSASPEPSESPSAAPSSPAPTRSPITQQQLSNATLDLPSWGTQTSFCPHGRVTLHNGTIAWNWPAGYAGGEANLQKVAAVDLDGDGSSDAVAVFFCGISNPGNEMAVAFQRGTDGSIATMGVVAPDMHQITDVRTGANGAVDLQVSNLNGTDDVAHLQQVVQWRSYRWTGGGFAQTDGPTSFTVARPDLTATVSNLTFDAPVNGKRAGTVTVSVHNGGSAALTDASVIYELSLATVTSPSCDTAGITGSGQCPLQSIARGATGTLTLRLSADDATISYFKGTNIDQIGGLFVQIRVGGLALTSQPKIPGLVIK